MAIEEQVVVLLAVVEVTDEHRVQIEMLNKKQDFTPDQAEALAEELLRSATFARQTLGEQLEDLADRMAGTPAIEAGGEVIL